MTVQGSTATVDSHASGGTKENIHVKEMAKEQAFALGLVMQVAVRTAILACRRHARRVQILTREPASGTSKGPVTNLDIEVQRMILEILHESFPDIGIVAEENGVDIPARNGANMYFTVDPIDGTSALVRGEERGVGCMISFVNNNEVVASVVGDVFTKELFCALPGEKKSLYINAKEDEMEMSVSTSLTLRTQDLHVRGEITNVGKLTKALMLRDEPVFDELTAASGSIGLSAASLWKGQIGGLILVPQNYTRWDWCPIECISRRMGFAPMRRSDDGQWAVEWPQQSGGIYPVTEELLLVHQSRVNELR